MIAPDDRPLLLFMWCIGAVVLGALAMMIGMTHRERAMILALTATLIMWNAFALYNALDRRMSRWIYHGNELYFRAVRRWHTAYTIANARWQEAEAHIVELEQALRTAQSQERGYQNRLAERERDVAAARKHAEDIREEAQRRVERLMAEIQAMKEQGQAKVEYALVLLFVVLVCIPFLILIGFFPQSAFAAITEMFPR